MEQGRREWGDAETALFLERARKVQEAIDAGVKEGKTPSEVVQELSGENPPEIVIFHRVIRRCIRKVRRIGRCTHRQKVAA